MMIVRTERKKNRRRRGLGSFFCTLDFFGFVLVFVRARARDKQDSRRQGEGFNQTWVRLVVFMNTILVVCFLCVLRAHPLV